VTGRDNHLWLKLWRDRRTEFHQKTVNKFLAQFWSGLQLIQGSRVFVPLCGKSLDMIWLANEGYKVIGVELSPVAVKAFFRENHLRPVRRRMGKFTVWEHGNIAIFCGDYFSLDKADLGHIDMVYDRAALTALPEDIRKLYVAQLRLIVPESAKVFLLTTEDTEENLADQMATPVDREITSLYSADFHINLAHVESVLEIDSESPNQSSKTSEYKVYRLSPLDSL
jgi:thiopurine S-methyltransferase